MNDTKHSIFAAAGKQKALYRKQISRYGSECKWTSMDTGSKLQDAELCPQYVMLYFFGLYLTVLLTLHLYYHAK